MTGNAVNIKISPDKDFMAVLVRIADGLDRTGGTAPTAVEESAAPAPSVDPPVIAPKVENAPAQAPRVQQAPHIDPPVNAPAVTWNATQAPWMKAPTAPGQVVPVAAPAAAPAMAWNAAQSQAVPVAQSQAMPVVQPAPIAAPAQPAPTVPTTYTMEQLCKAGADLMNAGQNPGAILQQFGVQSVVQVPPARYGEFATALRQMGAKI